MRSADEVPFFFERHRLVRECRDALIEHIDGVEVPWSATAKQIRRQALVNLAARRLIEFRFYASGKRRGSVITDGGHETLLALLADYAEALLRVGYGGMDAAAPTSHTSDNGLPEADRALEAADGG